jgi:hypothetical protein
MTYFKNLAAFFDVACFNSALLDLIRVDVRAVLLFFLCFLHSKSFVTLPSIDRNAGSKYPLSKLTLLIRCHFPTSWLFFWSLTWFTIFSVTSWSVFRPLTWFMIFSVTYDTRDKLIGYPLSDQECNRTVISFLVSLWACDIMGIYIGYPVINWENNFVFIWYRSSGLVKYNIFFKHVHHFKKTVFISLFQSVLSFFWAFAWITTVFTDRKPLFLFIVTFS